MRRRIYGSIKWTEFVACTRSKECKRLSTLVCEQKTNQFVCSFGTSWLVLNCKWIWTNKWSVQTNCHTLVFLFGFKARFPLGFICCATIGKYTSLLNKDEKQTCATKMTKNKSLPLSVTGKKEPTHTY